MNFEEFCVAYNFAKSRLIVKLTGQLELFNILNLETDINKKGKISGRVQALKADEVKYRARIAKLEEDYPVYAERLPVFEKAAV